MNNDYIKFTEKHAKEHVYFNQDSGKILSLYHAIIESEAKEILFDNNYNILETKDVSYVFKKNNGMQQLTIIQKIVK